MPPKPPGYKPPRVFTPALVAFQAAGTERNKAEHLLQLAEELSLGPPMAAAERQAVNEQLQHLLVRLSRVVPLVPGEGLRHVREQLKQSLAGSQQQVRLELSHREPAAVARAAPPQVAHPETLTLDLGPAGHPGVVSLGPQVAELQRCLQAIGLDVLVSGRYDGKTLQAVRKLQGRHHAAQHHGLVDAATRQLLQNVCGGAP